jgi:isocitrate dehydrogenase
MLSHLGLLEAAANIENALLYTLESGIHTGDFGDKTKPAVNTTGFCDAIIENMGKKPQNNPKPVMEDQPSSCTLITLDENPMMVTEETEQEKIVGVDMFIESDEQPEFIAGKCKRHGGVKFDLVTISNRGTQVWPTGSKFTNLINQYRVRFESINLEGLHQQDVIGLYVSLSGDFKICSLELLNMWADKKGYSLAQGQ